MSCVYSLFEFGKTVWSKAYHKCPNAVFSTDMGEGGWRQNTEFFFSSARNLDCVCFVAVVRNRKALWKLKPNYWEKHLTPHLYPDSYRLNIPHKSKTAQISPHRQTFSNSLQNGNLVASPHFTVLRLFKSCWLRRLRVQCYWKFINSNENEIRVNSAIFQSSWLRM